MVVVEDTGINVCWLVSLPKDEVSVNLVSGCVTNVGKGGGLGMIGFSLGDVSKGLVSTAEVVSILPAPRVKEFGN